MKLPKLVTGWVVPRDLGRVHEIREAAYENTLRDDMLDKLYPHIKGGGMSWSLTPEVAVSIILEHYHVEPKHIEETE